MAQSNVILRKVGLTIVMGGLALHSANSRAQEPDEFQQLRDLLRQHQQIIEQQQKRDEQQQGEINALKEQVRALQKAGKKIDRLAEDAKREVDSVRQDVAQAQDDAGQARELAETVRAVTIEQSQAGLGDWTRSTLGASPSEPVGKEEVATGVVVTEPEGFSVSIWCAYQPSNQCGR